MMKRFYAPLMLTTLATMAPFAHAQAQEVTGPGKPLFLSPEHYQKKQSGGSGNNTGGNTGQNSQNNSGSGSGSGSGSDANANSGSNSNQQSNQSAQNNQQDNEDGIQSWMKKLGLGNSDDNEQSQQAGRGSAAPSNVAPAAGEEQPDAGLAAQAFSAADADDSTTLSQTEYENFTRNQQEAGLQPVDSFNDLDADGNAQLSSDEFSQQQLTPRSGATAGNMTSSGDDESQSDQSESTAKDSKQDEAGQKPAALKILPDFLIPDFMKNN